MTVEEIKQYFADHPEEAKKLVAEIPPPRFDMRTAAANMIVIGIIGLIFAPALEAELRGAW